MLIKINCTFLTCVNIISKCASRFPRVISDVFEFLIAYSKYHFMDSNKVNFICKKTNAESPYNCLVDLYRWTTTDLWPGTLTLQFFRILSYLADTLTRHIVHYCSSYRYEVNKDSLDLMGTLYSNKVLLKFINELSLETLYNILNLNP